MKPHDKMRPWSPWTRTITRDSWPIWTIYRIWWIWRSHIRGRPNQDNTPKMTTLIWMMIPLITKINWMTLNFIRMSLMGIISINKIIQAIYSYTPKKPNHPAQCPITTTPKSTKQSTNKNVTSSKNYQSKKSTLNSISTVQSKLLKSPKSNSKKISLALDSNIWNMKRDSDGRRKRRWGNNTSSN